ncbi:VacB/RNase II family 3'-5' exoribonuclease [Akkermansiaceae bacterium]|nr:VacB/RNase II family 3'-5' exoribonuclease [Akkermansiaceae bacterium]
MRSPQYQPMNKSELARALNLHSNERGEMRKALDILSKSGEILLGKKARYTLRANKAGRLVGDVKFLAKGGALFFPDLKNESNLNAGLDLAKYQKVMVPQRFTGVALDGDTVIVQISKSPPPRDRRNRGKDKDKGKSTSRDRRDEEIGKILKIVKRKRSTMIGQFNRRGKFQFVQPEDTLLPASMDVEETLDAKPGQVVVFELEKWENEWDTPLCKIVQIVGWPEDPGVDILSVIHKHKLRQEFAPEVIAEAKAAHELGVPASELERREDWREKNVFTIDPFDAKDFDDAIAVEKTDKGWRLAVHIADVSFYVKSHTELDKEAVQRGNSTYLVDRVLPMLPEELCNDICSLKPHVDRLSKCALIEIANSGELIDWYLCDAVIHSKRRFTYEEAQTVLDSESDDEIENNVREAWKMASALRKKRFVDGSLDLEFPEVKVILDDKFIPIRVDKVTHSASHQLIEECMLAANEVVARTLKRRKVNTMYRIHEEPSYDKLLEFAELAKQHEFNPGDLSNKEHVQKLIEDIKGHPSEMSIKIGLLKSLKRAAYSVEGLGHYGLGKQDYCHFTSPIRRYSDLVVHRGIQALLKNPPAKPETMPKKAFLEEQADHISDTERTSSSAETETKRMKLMELMFRVYKGEIEMELTGSLTECRKSGAFVEIDQIHQRGMVKIEDFPNARKSNWKLEQGSHKYIASGGREIKLGQKVGLELVLVDTSRQLIDLRITDYDLA